MDGIPTYRFNADTPNLLKKVPNGFNWPVVYIIHNDTEAYVGQTDNASYRAGQHWANPERRRLTDISIISDDTFNKSVILDLEAYLIERMTADGRFKMQNASPGERSHGYFNSRIYQKRFPQIWDMMRGKGLASKTLADIENSDLFKYSPYHSLSTDQYNTILNIIVDLAESYKTGIPMTSIIKGGPGTGKTILAVYLMKMLKDRKIDISMDDQDVEMDLNKVHFALNSLPDMNIGFVVPQQSLRDTLKRVFDTIPGMSSYNVYSPMEIPEHTDFDLLVVDEAHRLRQRKSLSQYPPFDKNNRKLGLDDSGTELDWIMMCSRNQILFYDELQSVKPSDVPRAKFDDLIAKPTAKVYKLETQFRCKAGDEYIRYIRDVLSTNPPTGFQSFQEYDLLLFENFGEMVQNIRQRENEYSLCRLVAGYAWEWKSKKNPEQTDIVIDGIGFKWNSTDKNWVNSPNAANEIGCIHTVQGYDLNYCGVIFGKEIDYDLKAQKFIINKSEYKDSLGRQGILDQEDLLRDFILNIYSTLLTRGIIGTYVYACNDEMREYLKKYLPYH